jgi:hypothetical protein
VRDEEIKDRWREYFDRLFNGEDENPTIEFDDWMTLLMTPTNVL